MRRICLALLASVACAPTPRVVDVPAEPSERARSYTIWLGGARIGTAVETESASVDGVALRRVETMRFRRGAAEVALETTIEIDSDRALVPSQVIWTERGQLVRRASALRERGGWAVTSDGVHSWLPDAIPAELVPLVVRRDGRFAGRVFLPARGFAAGAGRVEPVAPDRLIAQLALDGGALAEATIDIDGERTYTRVVDGDGVIAILASPEQAREPFAPVDLIAATAIPITGEGDRLVLGGELALPPLPGQRARAVAGATELVLAPGLPGALPPAAPGPDRTREIATLVRQLRARIAPDLAAGPSSPRAAHAASAGDCTTYALAYAAIAVERAIPTRVVTGLRIDGARLIRHRWAVSWTGRAWIAVDAAFGAAPAGGDLIGLAVHDADDAGLVAGEAALARVRSASWR